MLQHPWISDWPHGSRTDHPSSAVRKSPAFRFGRIILRECSKHFIFQLKFKNFLDGQWLLDSLNQTKVKKLKFDFVFLFRQSMAVHDKFDCKEIALELPIESSRNSTNAGQTWSSKSDGFRFLIFTIMKAIRNYRERSVIYWRCFKI